MTDARPSKSARKRAFTALQELGETLILLSDEQLSSIATDAYLIEQIMHAKTINAHGALRRQKQLIGKIMREVDPEPIQLALAQFNQNDHLAKSVFKRSEHWRDRIATDGTTALQDFVAETGRESELLVSQLSEYESTADSERRRHIRRKMFREIHRILSPCRDRNEDEVKQEQPQNDKTIPDDTRLSTGDR